MFVFLFYLKNISFVVCSTIQSSLFLSGEKKETDKSIVSQSQLEHYTNAHPQQSYTEIPDDTLHGFQKALIRDQAVKTRKKAKRATRKKKKS